MGHLGEQRLSAMPLTLADIESLERATLQAVAPEQVHELPGWLLPMDHGTVGRAHSAVPLTRDFCDAAEVDHIAEAYRSRGFRPVLRIPDLPAFDAVKARLLALDFESDQPTLTQTARIETLIEVLAAKGAEGASLDERPDAGWMAMFLGAGFDPVDGASRAGSLARAKGTRYASVREGAQTLACGGASFGEGWLGVHGLRTAASQRGRGLAGRMLLAMAQEARAQGIERVYLQVHASSTSALVLYRSLGFQTAWAYAYWREASFAG
jgi:ribosomal protein S18 acetylase RimI-like enzyme